MGIERAFSDIAEPKSLNVREMIKIIGTGTPQQTHKTRPPSEQGTYTQRKGHCRLCAGFC